MSGIGDFLTYDYLESGWVDGAYHMKFTYRFDWDRWLSGVCERTGAKPDEIMAAADAIRSQNPTLKPLEIAVLFENMVS